MAPYAIYAGAAASVVRGNGPLDLQIAGTRVLRLEAPALPNITGAPNLIAGSPANYAASNVVGATIGGGGALDWFGDFFTNRGTADFGTIAGGRGNMVSGIVGVVGCGNENICTGGGATIAGGKYNVSSGSYSSIGGGDANEASALYTTASGGRGNLATAQAATVGGALAAIQGLNQKLEQELKTKDAQIRQLQSDLAEVKQLLQTLANR